MNLLNAKRDTLEMQLKVFDTSIHGFLPHQISRPSIQATSSVQQPQLSKNQPIKFSTPNWVEINNDSHRMYSTIIQIKFKTSMSKSNNGMIVIRNYLRVEL